MSDLNFGTKFVHAQTVVLSVCSMSMANEVQPAQSQGALYTKVRSEVLLCISKLVRIQSLKMSETCFVTTFNVVKKLLINLKRGHIKL